MTAVREETDERPQFSIEYSAGETSDGSVGCFNEEKNPQAIKWRLRSFHERKRDNDGEEMHRLVATYRSFSWD